MALSGSYTYTVPNTKSYVALKINWTATQNIAANNSTVKTTIHIFRKAYGAIYSSSKKTYTLTVNGTKYTGSVSIAGGNNSNATLATATTTVAHGSNGAKTFGISFSINFGGVKWGSTGATINTVSCSSNFTLNTIARASRFASVGNTLLNATVPINISSHSSSFIHKVDAKIGTTTIQGWKNIKGGAQTFTFSSAANTAIAKQLTQSTSVQINWALSTWSGTTQIGGYAGATSTISLPASELTPTAGKLTVAEANANAAKLFKAGSYIQGISQLKFTVSGSSATHGASIKSTAITFEGASYASGATSVAIKGNGAINAVATVTDSRGQSASVTVPVTVTAYQPPQMQTAIAMRSNASGGFVSDGTYCTVNYYITGSLLPLTSGANNITVAISKQEANASGWTQVKSTPYTSVSAQDTIVLGSGYDGTKEYNIKIVATDTMGGSNSVVIGLDVARVLMSWGKTQVGIGKVAQQGTLDVLGDQYLEGSLNVKNGNFGLTNGSATITNSIATAQPVKVINGQNGTGSGGFILGANGDVGINLTYPTGGTTTIWQPTLSRIAESGTVLWDGAWYGAGHGFDLPIRPMDCLNGYQLLFMPYDGKNIAVSGGGYCFNVPKAFSMSYSGSAVHFVMWGYGSESAPGTVAEKYLYFNSAGHIKGHANKNTTTNSKAYVLAKVMAY